MKRILIGLAMVAAFGTVAQADSYRHRTYEVTFTNITKGQPLAPVLVVTHKPGFYLFTPGEPAVDELATLAETGNPTLLAGAVDGLPGVADVEQTSAITPPGNSAQVEISARRGASRISIAAMLGSTNDAFAGLIGVELPKGDETVTYYAPAWDAGSEENNEACDYVPGPPCDNGTNERAPDKAEGFVHIHSGIHGVDGGGLPPSVSDWLNPVVKMTIRRIRHHGGHDD